MYHFILAVCLVYDISGEPVNPCFMVESPEYYPSKAMCLVEARKMEIEYVEYLSEKYPRASVVQNAPCGLVEGSNS